MLLDMGAGLSVGADQVVVDYGLDKQGAPGYLGEG
jgi:hypothetical protein